MERATAIATASLLSALASGVRGKPERDVAADLAREMVRRGAEGVSFPRSSRTAHAPRCPTQPRPGGDRGGRTAGPRFRRPLERVLLRRDRDDPPPSPALPPREGVRRRPSGTGGRDFLRPSGRTVPGVDARVRDSLDRSGYLKYFVHSTGHGVGLDVHERPSISPRSRERLEEGMVVTVEPGVYLPGIGGIRLEDTVKVTGSGCERITFLPKTHTPLV